MIDYESTIISQYGNSPVICALIKGMNEWIDPRQDFQTFFDLCWNVDTAVGFGLDIWGRIVGINRQLDLPDFEGCFGFQNIGHVNDFQNFGFGTFYKRSRVSPYIQADSEYRKMILAKAMANISQCSAPAINQLLQNIFPGRGRIYCNDLGGMSFKITSEFNLTPIDQKYFDLGIVPHPAGVEMTVEVIGDYVGFSEMGVGAFPFNEGTFRSSSL